MTITKVGNITGGGNGDTSNNNSVTDTLPAGCNPGDILLCVDTECSGSNTITNLVSTGFTVLRGPVAAGSIVTHYISWKALTSGDISAGSFLRQWSGAGRPSSSGIVLRGVDSSKITIDSAPFNSVTSLASAAAPSITTTDDNSFVCTLLSGRVASAPPGTVSTIASGWTKEFEAIVNQSGFAASTSAIHRLTTPGVAGSYGGETVNFSPNSAGTIISQVALAPLPVGTEGRYRLISGVWTPQTTEIM